jgi:hypothetical protein
MLQELIQKLQDEHGVSAEQSQGVINTVTQYLKDKFPMIGGHIDSLLGNAPSTGDGSAQGDESMIGKLEDMAKSKFGGLFGGNKS